MVEWIFLAVPWGCLRFVIVVFSDLIHLLFLVCSIWDGGPTMFVSMMILGYRDLLNVKVELLPNAFIWEYL